MIACSVLSFCQPRFQAGCLSLTPAVQKLVQSGALALRDYLCRHLTGDWGNISPSDRRANEVAIRCGGPILSSYHIAPDVTLCIATQADRQATTAFLADETLKPR